MNETNKIVSQKQRVQQTLKSRLLEVTSELKAFKIKNIHLEETLVIKEEEFRDAICETEKRLENVHIFADKLSAESDLLRGDKDVLDNVIKI